MAVRNYNSVNGVVRGHYDHGVPNSEVMYVRDGLGSVVSTVDARGNVLNQYRYKPWGELWQKTGSAPDPRFLWAGSWGYRAYGNKWVSHYVRARHYASPDATWTTVDPLWPRESAYAYVAGRVIKAWDRNGMRPDLDCSQYPRVGDCIDNLASKIDQKDTRKEIYACMGNFGYGQAQFKDPIDIDWFLDGISRRLSKKDALCVKCQRPDGSIAGLPKGCQNPCITGGELWGRSYPGFTEDLPPGESCGMVPFLSDCKGFKSTKGGACDCSVILCKTLFGQTKMSPCALVVHEVAHCSGLGHAPGTPLPSGVSIPRTLDFIYKLGCCTCMAIFGKENCGTECKKVWP